LREIGEDVEDAVAVAGQLVADLLDRYLGAHPRGALREEALALAIESADARGDERAARAWAAAYEASYPRGRFGAFARSHLEASSP